MDCSSDNMKLRGIGSGIVGRALQQPMIDESRRASFDRRLSLDLGNAELLKDTLQNVKTTVSAASNFVHPSQKKRAFKMNAHEEDSSGRQAEDKLIINFLYY
ncbi:hypothetical protein ACFX13_024809 [Malus domestica]